MRRQRKFKYIFLSLLVIAIASLSIAYAVLTTSLSISGNAEVQGAEWGMDIKGFTTTTTGNATYTTPSIEGTTISNYTVSLTKPGDSVTFNFFVENTGSIAAKIESIMNSTPTCTSSTGNNEEAEMVCNNLNIKLSHYASDITVGEIYSADSDDYCLPNELNRIINGLLYLTIEFDSKATSVPSSSVTISNLKNQINFIQSDIDCEPENNIIDPF